MIDSRNKRESAIAIGSPWRMRLPAPDSAVGAGDRRHVAYQYCLEGESSGNVGRLLIARFTIRPRFGGRVRIN